MRSFLVASVLALGLLASPVWAEATSAPSSPSVSPPSSGAPAPYTPFMKRADADGDGVISKAEFIADVTKRAEERFAGMDKNGDGKITPDEKRPFPGRPEGSAEGQRPWGPRHCACPCAMPEGGVKAPVPSSSSTTYDDKPPMQEPPEAGRR